MTWSWCPSCGGALTRAELGGRERVCCADSACGFVFWGNPTPVVAAVVEHRGKLLIARNVSWPAGMFGLVTGFLEAGESPEQGVVREVKEELDLDAAGAPRLIGLYPFFRMNQLLIAYHVDTLPGAITCNEELAEYKLLAFEDMKYWPGGTGLAVRDFLQARGYQPDAVSLPPQVRAYLAGE